MKSEKKVFLVYLTNLHYRRSLFEELGKRSSFILLAGEKSPYIGIKNNELNLTNHYSVIKLKNIFFLKGHHRLTFQIPHLSSFKLIMKFYKDAYFIFLGVDPHIITSIFYSFLISCFGGKVCWWGHGSLGDGIIKKIRLFLYKKAYRIFLYGRNLEIINNIELNKKSTIVGNCMNWEDYSVNFITQKGKKIGKDKYIKLLFSGRIIQNKKIDVLLNACRKLEINYELVIIGDGPKITEYRSYCQEYNLNVKFVGNIYGENVKKIMAWADLMVIPGKVGLSIVHAYGNCLPVLMHSSFNYHSPEFEIHTMNNSFLFKMDDSNDLAGKIEFIFKNKLLEAEMYQCMKNVYSYGYLPNMVADKIINSL